MSDAEDRVLTAAVEAFNRYVEIADVSAAVTLAVFMCEALDNEGVGLDEINSAIIQFGYRVERTN